MTKKLFTILLAILIYWILFSFVPYGRYATYPITLLVTFFHETGHAIMALITGGRVEGVQISPDGSGYALIGGGLSLLVIPGGYIGSAIWGNIFLYVGLYKEKYARYLLYLLIAILVFVSIYWFNSTLSTILQLTMAFSLAYINIKWPVLRNSIVLILGSTSLFYIIRDFYGGPGSDLVKFTQLIPILPAFGWALVWLALVLYMTYRNMKKAFKSLG